MPKDYESAIKWKNPFLIFVYLKASLFFLKKELLFWGDSTNFGSTPDSR